MANGRHVLGRSRRDQLLLYQAHALDHYWRPEACRGRFPNPPQRRRLRCPLCGSDVAFADLREEHAPPRSGQSSLGPAATVILTCAECNSAAGETFEREASQHGRLPTVPSDELACHIHGQRRAKQMNTGLYVVVSELPLVLTDLKAAFLLTFASLGYRWALSRELQPVRSAICAGHVPDPSFAWVGKIETSNHPGEHEAGGRAILEVTDPKPCIVVRRDEGTSVILPVPGSPHVPRALGRLRLRSFPWPRTAAQGRQIELVHREGHLFHADFCSRHWPSPRVPPRHR
jgi:5-methylcytosine-specific restriction endonuclease McrA